MSMRPLAALGLAGLFVLACVSLARAQDATGQCIAKDQVIAANQAPGVHYRKVTGGDADALRVFVNSLDPASKPDGAGYTYVVFWMVKGERALVVGFDEHNCGVYKIGAPKDEALKIIGGVGA